MIEQSERDPKVAKRRGISYWKIRSGKLLGYARLYYAQRRRLEAIIEEQGSNDQKEALREERREWERVKENSDET